MIDYKIDSELIERIKKGDKRAFDLIVIKYQYRIIKLVGRYVSNYAEVLDITQDIFVKIYRGIDNFQGKSSFFTWIYRISLNTIKNYYSSSKKVPKGKDIESVINNINVQDCATPEHNLLGKEIEDKIFATIDELPDNLRTVILLREIEGLTYAEIAQIMQCPVGTVRSRIFRAREAIDKKIKKLLEQ